MAPRHEDDPAFPMFKAGFALMALVAVLAIVSTLVRTEEGTDSGSVAVSGSPEAVSQLPAPSPGSEDGGVRSALLAHWNGLAPLLERLGEAREGRDLDELEAVHLELIARIDEMPEPDPASGAAERQLHLAYSSAMNAYEDAVDDLVHGVREDDAVEWSEGIRELRIADGQMEMLLRRMGQALP